MSKSPIQELIKNNLTIPTLPEIVLRISEVMEDPESGVAEIGSIVAQDAPLAAKVLRIANSSYYGLSGECVSTEHATTVLGVRVLKNIVTQVSVINMFEHLEDLDFDMDEIWKHNSFTGHLCAKLAATSKNVVAISPDEAYVCGLLHDVGKVVILDGLGRRYTQVYKDAKMEGVPLFKKEREELSFNHTDVGAVVARRWDLPDKIVRAIQFHHGPREKVAGDAIVSVVAHANLLAHRVVEGADDETVEGTFDVPTRQQLGLDQAAVAEVVDFAREHQDVDLI